MKRFLFALAGLATLIPAGPGFAGVDADPNKDYTLTAEAGPWLICATCYVGDKAWQSAHEMCLEIRKRYNLPAYILNRGEKERKQQQAEVDQLQKQYPNVPPYLLRRRMPRIQDQCAVLIGGYKDMDEARAAQKEIKRMPADFPEHLMPILVRVTPTGQQADGQPQGQLEYGRVNPFVNSFVTRNPEIPMDKSGASKAEEYSRLVHFNRCEKYSLLDSPKPWTLVVAVYQGTHAFVDESKSAGFLERLFGGGDTLEASGRNAHNLASALRDLNYRAYVLHTRQGSIVTVGEFESEKDPRMQQVRQALQDGPGGVRAGPQLQLLPDPIPFPVPTKP
jgi:hypothetical protein